ncbi:hypothetical protein K450DRAFT_301279 [Umbelopsis ramanniana AG]|uniref:U6 small nuclear RNA (adenine-(43)-N(6))-methyltransferase n=1 Tax=Umbelopsis ramanniana AG TaxID=1314678 RepID=A0AAD5E7Q4_UMBRA|nr:uncharacterized protein K450DRAFT_301279 [Umbelopsis ramanniana AG]KAI8578277.1 hypothetical protein K450DRAFT_301279 [Umbelopsis ramanniana AG]
MSNSTALASAPKRTREQYVAIDLGENMHERNIYRNNRPDFKALAEEFPSIKDFVHYSENGSAYIDFKNAEASRALTQCLFKKDFNLDVEIPENTLCPPIPNRLNYILWIEDLLSESHIKLTAVRGIDIGVGASCVYPLLGCATNKSWQFIGTEVDAESVKSARRNVNRNDLHGQITIYHNRDRSRTLPLDKLESEGIISPNDEFAFSMCNPPFYGSSDEIQAGIDNKIDDPAAVCTGTESEMITEGGEVQFITNMIEESLKWKNRIKWYTTMIGKGETLGKIRQKLMENKASAYCGNGKGKEDSNHAKPPDYPTDRQLYCDRIQSRPHEKFSYNKDGPVTKKIRLAQAPKSQFSTQLPCDAAKAQEDILEILNDLNASQLAVTSECISGSMVSNTWSRKARRQRAHNANATKKDDIAEVSAEILFTFKFDIQEVDRDNTNVIATWTKGKQREVFESFWNHVKKRILQDFGIVQGDRYKPHGVDA